MAYCKAECVGSDEVLAADPADMPLIRDWIGQGYPLIARMRREGDPVTHVALGLPMPLEFGKKRIALSVVSSALDRVVPPPLLENVLQEVPIAWQPRIAALSENLACHLQEVRVVGSLAWQALTGKTYLHPKSDIDLLMPLTHLKQLQPVLDILAESDLIPGPRIDGEIVGRDGEAISWRELCSSSRDVLVKTLDGPKVCLRETWLNQFREHVA
jgi:phosphoribosyl-dephospho-CoA transferase